MAYLGSESLARGGWTSIEISRNHASASSGPLIHMEKELQTIGNNR